MKRIKKMLISGALGICLAVQMPAESIHAKKAETEQAIEEPENLYALSACMMDADSGRVLFEKEGNVHRANASTTKIMTLILTLEQADLDETVEISARAARQPDVQLNVKEGEQYRLGDLCYSLMLESHNDSAVAIAEHVGGSVEQFAALMNEKADEIGCENTYFLTPNGLDEKDAKDFHGTSAIDLAKIMRYCVAQSPKAEQFLEITRMPSYTFSDISGKRSFQCNNHNAFLQMMEGALSGKTGFTGAAGYCYVGALSRDGKTLIVSLLGCGWPNNKTYKWKDCRTLFNYGLENYEYMTDQRPLGNYQCALVNGAAKSGNPYDVPRIELLEENHEPIRLLLRSDEKITVREQLEIPGQAPVEYGQDCGRVNYYLEKPDGESMLIYSAPIYAAEDVPAKNFVYYVRYILECFLNV